MTELCRRRVNFRRTLVVGNSGSGKSWLSERLASCQGIEATDLDSIHWEPGGYAVPRDEQCAREMIERVARRGRWIIEGVYGHFAAMAIPRATAMVWLDLPVAECLDNLGERGPRRGGTVADVAALARWAADYPIRQTLSSWSGHERLFTSFERDKVRLSSRAETAAFLALVSRGRDLAEGTEPPSSIRRD